MEFDPDGNIWVGLSYQAGAVKIDRKTKEVKTFPLPAEWANITTQTNMVTPTHMYVDNKVWMTDTETHNLYRLDLKTGQWENKGEATTPDGKKISGYGLPTDKYNNVYMFSFGDTRIGTLDGKTNVAQIWSTPTPRSRPRRGRLDDQGQVWFAEYAGNAIGMFDPATQKIKEYKIPTPWSAPYDVAPDQGRRRGVDRLDDERPGLAARHQERRGHGISAAAHHQHPARVRAGDRPAAGALGRQQSRRRDRQGRAAGLMRCAIERRWQWPGIVPAICFCACRMG